jgi:hypothetical protein
MLRDDSTKNVAPAAKMLPHLFAAGALLLAATSARAHEDPPGCFKSGPGIVISVLRADGVTGFVGAASQCETITYRVTLRKAIDSDEVCAFSGGSFTLTTPDGVVHDVSMNVPCIGGTTAPCDPAVDAVASGLISYTVNPADVIGGFAIAVASYAGGVGHDSDADTPGISGTTPKATPVVLCDDGDACSQNVCDPEQHGAAACSNPPVDCDDHNACTTDSCGDGVCNHVAPDPTCVPCSEAADCNDHNACTTDACTAGICEHAIADPTCVPCETPADCNDQNACTTDACSDGICGHTTPDPTCVPCGSPADCNDQNACTTELCTEGICGHTTPDPTCVPCETAADCNDQNACTTDACTEGICGHTTPDPTCVPCETASECNDGNPCTTEQCSDGICGHTTLEGCTPCETAADCNDHNACTTDACGEDGTCERTTIAGCVPCETAAQCDDGNSCTTDTCPAGSCVHATIDDCPIEVCDNGVDDDGDGLVDCADSDCANNPVCPTEICGNCIDDDGDGKIDYEDDDCCDNTGSMTIRKMAVRTKSEVGKNRLVFKALYSPRVDPDFNPATAGTTLQLRDADGTFFCQDIPFKSDLRWIKKGVFKFRDKTGLMAAGLRKAKFKVAKKDRHATFKTRGKKMDFREPVSTDVVVTLRVGSQCTQATAALHTKRAKTGKKLVYP